MQPLKQLNTDADKHAKMVQVIRQYEASGMFKNIPDLGERIDFAHSTIYGFLNGKQTVSDIFIYKFCEYFQLRPAYFFGRSEKLQAISENINGNISQLLEMNSKALEIAKLSGELIGKAEKK